MTTGSILLPIAGATLPDGTTSNIAARFQRTKSTATAPAMHWVELLFDPSTEQGAFFGLRMPQDYASGLVAKYQWKVNATSNAVVWGVQVAALAPSAASGANAKALATTNTATTSVLATTARRLTETSIAITNDDSVAAGNWLNIRVYRVAANGSDTCVVDAELVAVTLEYTTI